LRRIVSPGTWYFVTGKIKFFNGRLAANKDTIFRDFYCIFEVTPFAFEGVTSGQGLKR
jgi:hypothetical protein